MKKIFLSLLLFLFIQLPALAQGTTIYLPLILKATPECGINMNNGWSFVAPVESTNYVLNPSGESSGNYSALGAATVTRVTTYQKYGLYSFRVQTGSNGQGISLTLSALTNSVHFATFRVRGQLPVNSKMIIGTGLKSPQFIEKIDDNWKLYGASFSATESNGRTELRIIQQGNGKGDFYIDGVQVEPLAYWTTYCDGTQEGCAWNGPEHAATSTRSGLSLAGGQVKDFYDDYGFFVEKVIGGGATSQSVNIDEYAILPGGELNSIKIQSRDMTIVGKFIADSEIELHDKQQALHLALSSENYPNNQSFKLRFSGARVQKEIKVNYKGGLEGELGAFYCRTQPEGDADWADLTKWTEKASIQLQAPDPYWYETGESAASLDANDSATFRIVAGRLKSTGQWNNLGPPAVPGTAVYTNIRAIAEDANYIYLGGNFQNFDNQANCDYICRYNKLTGLYSPMGTGGNNIVYALVIGSNGLVYASGAFTSMGGVASTSRIAAWDPITETWSALGSGLDNVGYALAVGLDGTLYAAGQFTTAGGIIVNCVAAWNPVTRAWSALGGGLNNNAYALAVGPDGVLYVGGDFGNVGSRIASWNGSWSALGSGLDGAPFSLTVSPNNVLYATGSFLNAGGNVVNQVASWNGSWSALGSGLGGAVPVGYALTLGQDGILYVGGQFTEVGGITLADRIAVWNGYAWAHLDIDLPGSAVVFAIYLSKFINPVISRKYDLYLGFDTTGTGYFAGKTTVNNEGSALAFPKVVYGRNGGTAIIIETLKNEITGKELLFDYSLLDGEKLTIDLTPTKKSIVSNYFGPRLDAILANSDFGTWVLMPGNNIITSFAADDFALYPSSLDSYLLWKDRYKSYN